MLREISYHKADRRDGTDCLDREERPGGRLADIIFWRTPQLLILLNTGCFFMCLELDKLPLSDTLGGKIP